MKDITEEAELKCCSENRETSCIHYIETYTLVLKIYIRFLMINQALRKLFIALADRGSSFLGMVDVLKFCFHFAVWTPNSKKSLRITNYSFVQILRARFSLFRSPIYDNLSYILCSTLRKRIIDVLTCLLVISVRIRYVIFYRCIFYKI